MKVEINTDALGRDISNLQGMSKNLKTNLNSLNASMQALNQTWEGTAKTAYQIEYQKDQQSMEELCSILEEFIQTLEYAKKQYISSDNSIRSIVSQIRV